MFNQFRVWDNLENRFLSEGSLLICPLWREPVSVIENDEEKHIIEDRHIIEQLTDSIDANGIYLYIGDILCCDGSYFKVVFEEWEIRALWEDGYISQDSFIDCIKVGNIHVPPKEIINWVNRLEREWPIFRHKLNKNW